MINHSSQYDFYHWIAFIDIPKCFNYGWQKVTLLLRLLIRPGDIYHPDFHLGRPAYFDLSVRSTTQSAVISSASSQAWVAAAVGKIAKDTQYQDTQYQDTVNDNGGDFISLVCETFGVWSPYALSILGSIADRTTVRNGLPRKFARRQLLQQLSVTLWRYNAKMILRQYSLTAEDEFPDFDIG